MKREWLSTEDSASCPRGCSGGVLAVFRQARQEVGRCRHTHLGFLLQIEGVDFLEFSLESEEKSGLVGLEGGLGILRISTIRRGGIVGGEDRGRTQLLDELWKSVGQNDGPATSKLR